MFQSERVACRRPHRIAILGSRGIPARYGGFETFVEELSPRLVERGLEVTVFCEATSEPRPTSWRGVDLKYVPIRGPRPLQALLFDLVSLWRARRDHDVVYMLGYGAALFCWLPRLFGAKVWINMDGLEWRRSKWGLLARTWLRLQEAIACRVANRLVFDNEALIEEVGGDRKLPDISVIAYGTHLPEAAPDPAPLRALGLEPGGYNLVVCRFEPENHVLEIARATQRQVAARPLVIVTNPQPGQPGAAELASLEGERVRNLGPIYDPRLLAPLRWHCAAYLHGHSVGGTNPSLDEAMGHGGVVLAHDNPFNRVTLGLHGRFFSDETELEALLVELAEMPAAQRRQEGSAVRLRARMQYSWESITDSYLALMGIDAASAAQRAAA